MFHSAHAKNTTWQSALQDCLDELDENLDNLGGFDNWRDTYTQVMESLSTVF